MDFAGGNPLGMRPLEPGGPFVLPPQLCSQRRREFFERGNRLTFTFISMLFLAHLGRQVFEATPDPPDIPTRITIDGYVMQTSRAIFTRWAEGSVPQLANQLLVAIYGNLEAFIGALVRDAAAALGHPNPDRQAVDLMYRAGWPGRMDRIADKLGLRLGRRAFRQRYEGIALEFMGKPFVEPLEFLDELADIRHRLVHSAGRIDATLVEKYPEAGLTVGDPIHMPPTTALGLHTALVPMTDLVDERMAQRFGWHRGMVAIEALV